MLHNMQVVRVCFKCFRCFIRMLQVFHLDVAKVDLDFAYVYKWLSSVLSCFASVSNKCLQVFQVFQLFSDVCCKCFVWML
jgi:hypothetical protein